MSFRPKTLREVAEQSASLQEFGLNLRDWLHELRRASSRPQVLATMAEPPPLLHGKFEQGVVADAWLAAYAEHVAQAVGRPCPLWAFEVVRISPEPLFDAGAFSRVLRALALKNSPAAFRRRNIFTVSVDLPLRLRAGRPAKSTDEKRRTNAERQRRFRRVRAEELAHLRALLSVDSAAAKRPSS